MVISLFSALAVVLVPQLNLALEQGQKQEYRYQVERVLEIVVTAALPVSFLVTLAAFGLARRAVRFAFPVRTMAINLLVCAPFYLISQGVVLLVTAALSRIVLTGLLCAIYFLCCQVLVLKNTHLTKLLSTKEVLG